VILDGGQGRVQVLTPKGKFIFGFGDGKGKADGTFSNPLSIAIDLEENFIIADCWVLSSSSFTKTRSRFGTRNFRSAPYLDSVLRPLLRAAPSTLLSHHPAKFLESSTSILFSRRHLPPKN